MHLRQMLAAAVAVAAVAAPAAADVKITTRTEVAPHTFMGQDRPGSESSASLWLGDGTVRLDSGDQTTILDAGAGRLLFVNHKDMVYSEVPLPVDLESVLSDEDRAYLEKTRPMWAMSADVTPTDETREIDGRTARRYDVHVVNSTGIELDVELWAAPVDGVDLDLVRQLKTSVAALQPTGSDWMREILAIDGLPVEKITTMSMGDSEVTTHESLVSIERDVAPEAGYAPPESYEKVEFDPRQAKPLVRQ